MQVVVGGATANKFLRVVMYIGRPTALAAHLSMSSVFLVGKRSRSWDQTKSYSRHICGPYELTYGGSRSDVDELALMSDGSIPGWKLPLEWIAGLFTLLTFA